jgi:16S rRNA (cytosine1402-N4)-methyltransferase
MARVCKMASPIGQRTKESVHRTVLLNETIDGLNLKPDAIVLDCTFGGGGHSHEILRRFPKAKIIALDQDRNVWKTNENRISFFNENFSNLDKILNGKKVDGIIFDLGLSSDQLENSGRGFSFMKDEPLTMTMKENPSSEDVTAEEVVNTWEENNLADIIFGYGEEKFARRIAKAIVIEREKAKIKTTQDLVKIIESAVPGVYKRGRIHFATRTFQALRIAVNDELGVLQKGLEKGLDGLKKNGKMAVISFHSLEDRITKRFYKKAENEGRAILINKKPIKANKEEVASNPRSRSAKLRILEKL